MHAQVEAEEERVARTLQQCTRRIRELGSRGRVKDAIQVEVIGMSAPAGVCAHRAKFR